MKLYKFIEEKTKREYFEHSHIIYLSTVFAYFLIIPLFYFAGSILVAAVSLLSLLVTIIAILFNRKGYYGLASLLFISIITIQTAIEVVVFGLESGFQYYFFNMLVLIVFARWKTSQKYIAVGGIIAIFVSAFALAYLRVFPTLQMETPFFLTFHILNILLNVIGVSRTSHYFLSFARKAEKDLLDYAQTDFLTKLPNRAGFHNFVSKIQEKYKGKAMKPLMLLMIDIDHFKDINDKYGHTVGDEVLVEISNILKRRLEGNDFLSRYGGEEFVLIHFVASEDEGKDFAENLRKDIEKRTFRVEDIDLKLTISAGALFKSGDNTKTCEEVIEEADFLLYDAKQNGRNQIAYKKI